MRNTASDKNAKVESFERDVFSYIFYFEAYVFIRGIVLFAIDVLIITI